MKNASPLRNPSLSIVIPLFNEQENIPDLIQGIFNVLAADPKFKELILVDDGSADNTAQLVSEFAARDHRIKLLTHPKNRGLGAAIRTGLRAASGDVILYTDADLPFDFQLIPELVEMVTDKNIVIGYRQNRGEGGRRWVLSQGYNLLSWLLIGDRIKDVNFACKLLPYNAVTAINLQSEGSFIDVELLLECKRNGFLFTQTPMTYYPRTKGESTLSRPKVIYGILAEMIAYLRRSSSANYELQEKANHQRG